MVAQSIVTIISTQCCHSDASNNNGQAYQPTSASLAPLFVYSISSNNATKTKSNNQEPNTTCRAAHFKTECINRPGFPFPAGTLSLSECVCGCRDCTVLCETLQAARTMRQSTRFGRCARFTAGLVSTEIDGAIPELDAHVKPLAVGLFNSLYRVIQNDVDTF